MDRPFTIRRGGTLLDMAGLVHKDFVEGLKFARVWGSRVHDGTLGQGRLRAARQGRGGIAHVKRDRGSGLEECETVRSAETRDRWTPDRLNPGSPTPIPIPVSP